MTNATKRSFWKTYPSVNTRIIVPFLLAIITIAAIGIFTVTRLVAGSIQERFTNQLVASANSAANSIVDIETEHLNTLRMMVFTEGVAQAILDNDVENLDTWLRPIAATRVADEVIIANSQGEVLLNLIRLDTPLVVQYGRPESPDDIKDISNWENAQATLSGQTDGIGDKFVDIIMTTETEISIDGDTETEITRTSATIYFNAPVVTSDDERRVVGAIIVGLRMDNLVIQVSQQALSSVTLFGFDGQVLATTYRNSLNEINTNLAIPAAETAELLQTVQSDSPIREVTLDEIDSQVLHAPFMLRSDQYGILGVGLPSNYIVEQSGASRNLFGLIFGIFFLVVGILGIFIARTITGPIERLVNTTRAIREGDLSRRVEMRPRDELGELGVSFDSMTDQLVHRNREISSLLEQQVQETAQRQAVLTSISDAVIVQDLNNTIIMSNDTAQHIQAVVVERPPEIRLMRELLSRPERLNQPRVVNLADRYLSVLATPVTMTTNELLGYVIVFRDITVIIETEKLKDELVLQMSHELRTPLGAVRGYVDLVKMIEDEKLSKQGKEFIDKARDNLLTLERLVNQTIDVSAMLSNRFTIDIETFNLAYLLGDVFTEWRPAMQARDLQFTLVLPNNDMYIEGDIERLEELLDHLLRNAHSYTLPGGMVEIHAEITTNRAMISILDSGAGIGEDEIDRVFDRMYRGRAADAGDTDARGLGLGLYIAKQIVDAHQGEIIIESKTGLGTIVTVGLPVNLKLKQES